MTLDEAINELSYKTKHSDVYLPRERQLLFWLEELKQLRELYDRLFVIKETNN